MQKEKTKKIIKLLLDTTKSYREIAEECECSLATVNYWVKRIKASDLKLPERKVGKRALSIKDIL